MEVQNRFVMKNFKDVLIFLVVFNVVSDGVLYLLPGNPGYTFQHILLQGLLSSVLALIFIVLIQRFFARQKK